MTQQPVRATARRARIGATVLVAALAVILVGPLAGPLGDAAGPGALAAAPARAASERAATDLAAPQPPEPRGPTPVTAPGPDQDPAAVLAAGSGTDGIIDVSGYFSTAGSAAGYVPIAPSRVLDSRVGIGLAGPFASGLPRTLQIGGVGAVPADAVAVTLNLTVTAQTSAGYVTLSPLADATPATSSLNVPLGDNRANGLTVALAPDGSLAAVWMGGPGSGAHLLIDVSGYFSTAASAAGYVPIAPSRVLDSRVGIGLAGPFASGLPRTLQIGGVGAVPADAVAVTLNLTVTAQTSAGYVTLSPLADATPATSSLNVPLGDNRANGLTVALAPDGSLAAVWMGGPGSGAHLLIDVSGYFSTAASAAGYVPIAPSRVLDSRVGIGLAGPFASGLPRTLQIGGVGAVPGDAVAVTLNLTVTAQTSAGYVTLSPLADATPATSSLNVPLGDNRANGLTVALAPDGSLAAVWMGVRGRDYPGFDSLYHNEWEVIATIRNAEVAHPDIVDVFTVGQTHEGRYVWMAKISDNAAVDENEPEVFVDALHHAREHLTVEQALYLFETLTNDYDSNAQVRDLVDSRETWIIFALNPDGWAYDLGGSPYRGWRKNRQPNSGTTAVGTDPNRNYDYKWACCGGSSGNKAAWNYRGPKPFSSQEARIVRNFVNGRVVNGKQQIRTHVTLHTNGELILYPPGYTTTNVPSGMTLDDQRTFVAMARAMAGMNGYTAQQSSDLYVTDGDQIDWLYFRHRIFSFTFELYPTEQVSSHADHEPPDEVIAAQTARNRMALLYLMQMAECPYAAIGKQATYCP